MASNSIHIGGRHEFANREGGTCCMNCTERQVGCHATCEVYQASKAEYLENKKKIQDAKKQSLDYDLYKMKAIEKIRKQGKTKSKGSAKGARWKT